MRRRGRDCCVQMTPEAAALVRRRARNLLITAGIGTVAVGIATTQFVAWHLNYHPALGPPVFEHVYWPWSIISWWTAPWEPRVDGTFNLVRLGLLGSFGIGGLLFLKANRRQPRRQPDIHGSARFSTEQEIRKSGLWPKRPPKPGLIVGGWTDKRGAVHYLTDSSESHAICVGPTRSGKSLGVLVPTLLSWPHSMMIYDPKGELWQMSAGWRRTEADNIVMRFAPAEIENTVAWNPFDRVRAGTPYAYRDVANIIQQVVDPYGAGFKEHWEPSAANLMTGAALYLLGRPSGCSLNGILALIDSSAQTETMLEEMAANQSPQVAQVGRGLLATSARERASIISTARRLLAVYRDPIVAANTSRSDFRIEDLMNADRPGSLYIETRGEDELRLRPLVRLLLTVALGQLISTETRHRHPMIAPIDEFAASLRKMEPLEMFLAKAAFAGIRLMLLTQDYQKILAEYGEHESITSHCPVLTAYAPNDQRTAEWISKRSGETTVVVEEVSETLVSGRVNSTNRSYRSTQRALLTPDEVRRIKQPERDENERVTAPGEALIFKAGQHAIRGTQTFAFLDPEFRRRMAIPAPPTMHLRA
jgi:type IV secretion system protein VirD4